jgi:predicted ATPase
MHLEEGITRYTPDQRQNLAFRTGQDPGVACRIAAARTLWLLGYPDQALAYTHDALALAHELSHPFSLAWAQCLAAWVSQFRRDVPAAYEQADAAVALSTEQEFLLLVALGKSSRGWALAMQGQGEEGVAQVRVEQQEGRWWEAEIYRLRGVLLLRQTGTSQVEAETWLQRALNVARHQEAKSLELRAAMSLSHLWQQQGKRQEAYDLLAPIYHWFTEGFDTADLQDARTLLAELSR